MHLANTIRALVVGAALIHATPASAQRKAGHPVMDGVWRMDTTKFAKHDQELASLVLHVSHHGDTLLIVTDVEDVGHAPATMAARYLPEKLIESGELADTSRHVNAESWSGDTLVLRAIEARPDRTLQIEERWSIDPTGATLSRFQRVIDGHRVSQQILVFTRE